MFQVFQEEKLITSLMFVCLGASVLLRMFLGSLYQNMIKETDNMATTENHLLKQCKTKFTNCYQLSNGVANVPIFVDKFLNRLALGKISFGTIYHLSGQIMLLSVVFAGVGVCKSIIDGRTLGDILPFYMVSFFGLYLYFSVSTVVDIKGKRRVLKTNLVDYLENHLSPRINVTNRDIEMLYGEVAFSESSNARRRRAEREERSRGRGDFEEGRAGREEKRVIELIPINGRMAAGNEQMVNEPVRRNFAQEDASGQVTIDASEQETTTIYAEELESLLRELLTV